MPRTKETSSTKTLQRPTEEKILETEEAEVGIEVELKPDTDLTTEMEDELDAEDEASIDTEEIDPFKDTWEE